MTPKDKALELCQQYGYLGLKWKQTNYTTLALENAKQCALIAVDEILNLVCAMDGKYHWQEFYEEVKQEIEKL